MASEPTPTSRPPGRRHAAAAALALFGLLCGHTILEVARDSLFLSRLSAARLPGTYLAIAVVATIAAQVDARVFRRLDDRRVLSLTLIVGALGALAFHALFDSPASWVPRAFYVWTGTIATLAVAQFWRLLSNVLTVAEAKRLFAPIGAGGSLGAMVGAASTELAQRWVDPRGLLWLGASVLALAALAPAMLPPPEVPARLARTPEPRRETSRPAHAYTRKLLLVAVLTAVTATLVDFAFKATVDREIPTTALGTFFGRFYFGLNLVTLVVQVIVVPRVFGTLGVTRALLVLPGALAIGAAGMFAFGGMTPAILLRAADGGLRQSLHRSAVEVLYFPLSPGARKRYKASVDALGQRSGQAIGSLAILGAMLAGLGPRDLAIGIIALASAWAVLSIALRRGYLDLFRANLRAGAIEARVEVPQLDQQALESLIESLGSDRDEEVLATLELFVEHDRARLVPPLLLYHPSCAVVLRTLEILADAERTDFVPIARRLLEHTDVEVQAAAMRAIAGRLPAAELEAEIDRHRSTVVRAAALVALVARGLDEHGRARRGVEDMIASAAPAVRIALARAVRLQRDPALRWVLHVLTPGAVRELRRELARAFGALRDESQVGTLIHWVGDRSTRAEARDALVAIGEPALNAMGTAMGDAELPRQLRGHLPRTISRFVEPRAAQILWTRLEDEPDGWVRYKILRALRTLREALPALRFDPRQLEQRTRRALERATHVLGHRMAVLDAQARDPSLRTPAGALIAPVLREKEEQAVDRAIRLIALGHPRESVNGILHALRSGDRRLRAESGELLANLAPTSCGPALAALLEDESDGERLARAVAALGERAPPEVGYAGLLRRLIGDESAAVRSIAAHHAGELGLVQLEGALREAERRAEGPARAVIARALREILRRRGEHAHA